MLELAGYFVLGIVIALFGRAVGYAAGKLDGYQEGFNACHKYYHLDKLKPKQVEEFKVEVFND